MIRKEKDGASMYDTVRHVAKLARIKLNEAEIKKFGLELDEILKIFDSLGKVETKGLKPSYHPIEKEGTLREDKHSKTKWDPLKGVKSVEDNKIRGPKIV